MPNPVGSFIWYELMTPDPDAAAAFYGPVVGWTITRESDPGAGALDYRHILRSDGGHLGGVLRLTGEMTSNGSRPCWMPYFNVKSVDAEVAAIEAQGGKALMPTVDIEVGKIAMVLDPQSIPIYVMRPKPPAGKENESSDVFDPAKPQHVRWNELTSPDQAASMKFYHKHFGFEFNNKMPMGEMGDYWFIEHHGQTLGAIMQRHAEGQPALWLFYFGVPSITEAKQAVEANGGTVLRGPMEVPGGDWIIVANDPQGASFGLVGPKGD